MTSRYHSTSSSSSHNHLNYHHGHHHSSVLGENRSTTTNDISTNHSDLSLSQRYVVQQQQLYNQQNYNFLPTTTTYNISTAVISTNNVMNRTNSTIVVGNIVGSPSSGAGAGASGGRTTDLLKKIVLLCILALCSHIVNTLPHIQETLDSIAFSSSASTTRSTRTRTSTSTSRITSASASRAKAVKASKSSVLVHTEITGNDGNNNNNINYHNHHMFFHKDTRMTFFDFNIMDFVSTTTAKTSASEATKRLSTFFLTTTSTTSTPTKNHSRSRGTSGSTSGSTADTKSSLSLFQSPRPTDTYDLVSSIVGTTTNNTSTHNTHEKRMNEQSNEYNNDTNDDTDSLQLIPPPIHTGSNNHNNTKKKKITKTTTKTIQQTTMTMMTTMVTEEEEEQFITTKNDDEIATTRKDIVTDSPVATNTITGNTSTSSSQATSISSNNTRNIVPCLIHTPLHINTTESRYVKGTTGKDSTFSNNNKIVTLVLEQPSNCHTNSDTTTRIVTDGSRESTSTVSLSSVSSEQISTSTTGSRVHLRRDWTKPIPFHMLSRIAQQIEINQSNCTKPYVLYHIDNDYGLGSHLYLWTQAICNAEQYQHSRIGTYNPFWLWRDQIHCTSASSTTTTSTTTVSTTTITSTISMYDNKKSNNDTASQNQQQQQEQQHHVRNDELFESPFQCYFPRMEQRCPNDNKIVIGQNDGNSIDLTTKNITHDPRDQKQRCNQVTMSNETLNEYRTGAIEYIFQQVSPLVVQEAHRQLELLFGRGTSSTTSGSSRSSTLSRGTIPKNLITVHIRWGDKFWEMDLVPIEEYIQAVHDMVQIIRNDTNHEKQMNVTDRENEQRNIDTDEEVNIYLASEDPQAVHEFVTKTASYQWNIYVDRTVPELSNFRPVKGNRASWTTRNTRGRAGLVALGSLLLALESKYYILTTASNYSRLINELRKSIIDRECNNCTRMIDLRSGVW